MAASHKQNPNTLLDEPQSILICDQVLELQSSSPSCLKKLMRIIFGLLSPSLCYTGHAE